jgi:DNA-binding Lrp family transcriptional regulator
MQQSITKLNESEIKFLNALLEDGHKSDAQIARETKLSKPTTNRIRKKLEKEDVLTDYIPVIDLEKFGIQMFSVVLFEWTNFSDRKATEKMVDEFTTTPQVVYFAEGESSTNLNYCAVLGFYDLADYHAFFNEFREKYGKFIGKLEFFMIPGRKVIKQDFTDLAKMVIKRGATE